METKRYFLKNVDKTYEIESCEKSGDKYYVKFKNNETIYPYNIRDVVIETKSNDPFAIYNSIAQNIVTEDGAAILGRYYQNIQVNKNSLMYKYLNGTSFGSFSDEDPLIFPFNFNLSQFKATQNAFKNELSMIQGPPGTGKTQIGREFKRKKTIKK